MGRSTKRWRDSFRRTICTRCRRHSSVRCRSSRIRRILSLAPPFDAACHRQSRTAEDATHERQRSTRRDSPTYCRWMLARTSRADALLRLARPIAIRQSSSARSFGARRVANACVDIARGRVTRRASTSAFFRRYKLVERLRVSLFGRSDGTVSAGLWTDGDRRRPLQALAIYWRCHGYDRGHRVGGHDLVRATSSGMCASSVRRMRSRSPPIRSEYVD